jgi:hypothetical protein
VLAAHLAAAVRVVVAVAVCRRASGASCVLVARAAAVATAAAPASDAGAVSTEPSRALQECPMCMQGVHVLSYATTEVMQLVINNYDVGQHPIHLHGRRFYVLARGGKGVGAYNPNKFALNTKTPYVRDTVTIEHNSFVVIRFADKNPGLWLFRKFSNVDRFLRPRRLLSHFSPSIIPSFFWCCFRLPH